jgi:hypothetical protein
MPIGKQKPVLCVLTTEGVPQLSVAVGAAHCAIAQLSIAVNTMFAGQFVKTGFTVSVAHGFVLVTRTWKEHVAVLFLVSLPV